MRRLQTRITAVLVLILLVTIGANNYIATRYFKGEYTAEVQARVMLIAEGLGHDLGRILALGIPLGDVMGFEEQCRQVLARFEDVAFAAVTDPDGTVLFHDAPRREGSRLAVPGLTGIVAAGEEVAIRYQAGDGTYLTAVMPVTDGSGTAVAAVIVGVPEQVIGRKLMAFNAFSLLLAGAFFLVSIGLISTVVHRWVARPLQRLVATMQQVGEGNLGARITTTSRDEIGMLGVSFNAMVGQIEELLRQVKRTAQLQVQMDAEQRRRAQAEKLRAATRSLNSTLELEPVLALSLRNLRQVAPHAGAALWLQLGGQLACRGVELPGPRGEHDISVLHLTESRAARVLQDLALADQPLLLTEHGTAPLQADRAGPSVVVPLVVRGAPCGFLVIVRTSQDEPGTLEAINAYAGHVAMAIENASNHQQIREMAELDELTRIRNRRSFFSQATVEIDRAQRYRQPLSVVLFDIDHFKQFNDRHGHHVGDQVLREVAAQAGGMLRATDLLARYGGEEFVILLPHTDLRGAALTADRLRELIADLTIQSEGGELRLTISLGVAEQTDPPVTLEQLLQRADQALYEAKRHGRNRVVA